MEQLTFLVQFLRHPLRVSAVLPTGKRSAKGIVAKIPQGARVIVEYGPGTGPVAQAIMENEILPTDGKLILIERSPEMAKHLRKKFKHDPRVNVFCDSAEHVGRILGECGETQADCILASIPFSVIPEPVRSGILQNTSNALTAGGVFIVFLYRKSVGRDLQGTFSNVESLKVPRTLPPLRVFVAHK